ncbi:hypothetical protein SBI_06003 [Streptomyces bingchenggensis BCW-1]|uniref:Uncharacterized protein n=1 Tax=Streptomyces bingchenggensis (strain BCW-1) TaxID=749414 RepID=D7CHS3_STRBB|nr:hypothetical protein SBI_06003 [Streptomyces bingchenggensis BCW-1]
MADAKVIPFGEEPRSRRKGQRQGRAHRAQGPLKPVPQQRDEERGQLAETLLGGGGGRRLAHGVSFLRRRAGSQGSTRSTTSAMTRT